MKIPESIQDVVKWLPTSSFHTRETTFVHHASKGVESYIVMGAILSKSRDEKDWELAKCKNMKEYCESEMRVSYTQAIRMMTIWDNLGGKILEYYNQIKAISFVNLYEVARLASTLSKVQLESLLDQAATDTERGFKDNIRSLEGKVPHDECDHMNADKWFFKCRRCHKILPIEFEDLKRKINEIESGSKAKEGAEAEEGAYKGSAQA